MVEWYFYLEKGEAKGPLKKEAVIASLKEGKFSPLDLFYRQGQQKWLPAFQMQEFTFLFDEKIREQPQQSHRRDWILLKKQRDPTRPSFKQLGPFTLKELRAQLNAGEIHFDDYAWRAGFEKWTALRDLKEFKQNEIKPVPTLFPDEELSQFEKQLDKVLIEESLFQPKPTGEKPEEAGTADLTRPWEAEVDLDQTKTFVRPLTPSMPVEVAPLPKPAVKDRAANKESETVSATIKETVEDKIETKAERPKKPRAQEKFVVEEIHRTSSSRLWISRLFMLVLSVGFVFVVLVVASGQKDYDLSRLKKLFQPIAQKDISLEPKNVVTSPVRKESPEKVPSVSSKVESAKVEAPVVKAPVVPESVPVVVKEKVAQVPARKPDKISVRLQGENLEIVTNGSFHFPLRVQIFGQAGKVLAASGLYHENKVSWKAGEKPQLSLRKIRLPRGDYVVRVSFESLSYVTGLAWNPGSKDAFSSAKAARKAQALAFNRERRDLLALLERLEVRAQDLEVTYARHRKDKVRWPAFLKDWKGSSREIDRLYFSASLSQRTLPWYWYKVAEEKSNLQKKFEAYDKNVQAGVEVSAEVKNLNLPQEFRDLKEEIVQLKLF